MNISTLKLHVTIPVILNALSFASCSKATYSHIKWQENVFITDGKPTEWTIPLKFYDSDSKLNYDISNDEKNVFVIFKLSDDATKMKFLRAGMQFAMDINGEKKFPIRIQYPLGPQEPMSLPDHSFHPDTTSEQRMGPKKWMMQQPLIKLSGFKPGMGDGLIPLKNDYGIEAALSTEQDILYYELKIPFKNFYKETLTAADTIHPFNFEITLNALPHVDMSHSPPDDSETNDRQRGGSMPGGAQNGYTPGGGMSGGGMPGGNNGMGSHSGHGGGAGGMTNPEFEKHTMTFRLKLSLKK